MALVIDPREVTRAAKHEIANFRTGKLRLSRFPIANFISVVAIGFTHPCMLGGRS